MKTKILFASIILFTTLKVFSQSENFEDIYKQCKNKEYNLAIPKLYSYISEKPKYIPAYYELAKAYEYLNNSDSAIYFYSKTSELMNVVFLTTDLRYDEFVQATKDCGTLAKVKCARTFLDQRKIDVKKIEEEKRLRIEQEKIKKEEAELLAKKNVETDADKFFKEGEKIVDGLESDVKSIRKGTPSNKAMAGIYGVEYKEPDYKKAIELYEYAIKADTKYVNAYYRIGQIYEVQKNISKANEYYRKACLLNSKFCDDIALTADEIKFYDNLKIEGEWFQVIKKDVKTQYLEKGFVLKLNPKFESNSGIYYYSTFDVTQAMTEYYVNNIKVTNAKADWNRGILSISGGSVMIFNKNSNQFSLQLLDGSTVYFMKK